MAWKKIGKQQRITKKQINKINSKKKKENK